ncbi:uncharacterized protein LOC131927415, partial [Physella acuta]|uniref:uncharacterized protein LOC131927415 n=1 Tax=Physella acuta TaxID=109671 RepID=UPI0027DAB675
MLCALPNFLAKGTGFFSSHASINNNNDNNNSKDVVDINNAKDLEIPDQDEIKSVSSRNSLNFFKRVSRTVSIRNNSNFFKLKFNSLTLPIPLSTCVGLGIEDRVDSMIEAEVRRPKHKRRHLPEASGPYTVGCVDLMLGLADHGTFFRLYYPTNATNVQ